MNTPKTMIGLLALGLLFGAGTAAAFGGTLGGTYATGADVAAHADYSGVLNTVDSTKSTVGSTVDQAQSEASGKVDAAGALAVSTKDGVQASATKDAELSLKASADAKQGVLDGITGNIEAIGSWIKSIFVKPTIDAKHAEEATAAGNLASQVAKHDGSLDAYYGQDLASTAKADYNVPTPPTPDAGFLGELGMAFEGVLHIA